MNMSMICANIKKSKVRNYSNMAFKVSMYKKCFISTTWKTLGKKTLMTGIILTDCTFLFKYSQRGV